MKYTLIVMILAISFTSVARGVDQTNPTDRSIKIDWVKHPGLSHHFYAVLTDI